MGTNAEILANDPIFGDRTGSITIGPETLLVSQQGLGRAATQFACEMRHFITRLFGPGNVEQMVMMALRGGAFSIPTVGLFGRLGEPAFSRRLGAPTVEATISDDCAAVGRLRALEGANAFLAAIAAPRTARSAGGKDLARGFRDFNGDGLEEIGVFAPELGGAGRGAWLQLYNRKGKKVLSFFADKKLLLLQTVAMDTDGNGKAEAVLLGTEASGASELQLRNSNGGLEDRKSVSPEGSVGTVLMGFELDGARGEEIGIAHTDKKGTGEFAVWERTGKKLRRVAEHTVIPAKSAFHQWLRIDVDSDGREEIAAAYTNSSGKGASLRVMDPRSGKVLVDKKVLSTSFEQAVWMLGDFDTARSGAEFFVGYRRKGSGKASFKVLASDGTTLSTSPVLAKGVRAWGTIRSRRNSNGNARDLVFVAFADPKGGTTFEVWDPSTKKAKRIGAGTLASDEYEVLSLQAADFDGDPDNGTEIVAATRHLSNRDIGFQMFGSNGNSLGSRVQVFDNSYVSLTVSPIVFANKGRTDLALIARQVGGQPEVHVWNVNARALIKKISVLSKDVE